MFSVIGRIHKDATHEILDSRFHYTLDDAFTFFKKIGKDGRATYRSFYVQGYDVVIPMIMDTLFSGLLSNLYPGSLLNLLPFVRFVCDMTENVCVLILLENYPGREGMELIAQIGTTFGISKLVILYGTFILLFIGAMKAFIGWMSNKSKKNQ